MITILEWSTVRVDAGGFTGEDAEACAETGHHVEVGETLMVEVANWSLVVNNTPPGVYPIYFLHTNALLDANNASLLRTSNNTLTVGGQIKGFSFNISVQLPNATFVPALRSANNACGILLPTDLDANLGNAIITFNATKGCPRLTWVRCDLGLQSISGSQGKWATTRSSWATPSST